jgi:hypothetical protein
VEVYVTPEIEIAQFEMEDIITTSNAGNDDNNGENGVF